MSIVFSRQCEYALQAVLFLALHPEERISIVSMVKKLKIPQHFLAKILQDLASQGLLISQKGPSGGFALARPAAKIALSEIVEAVDGDGYRVNCVLGFPECGGKNPCSVHSQWGPLREQMHEMLAAKNLSELARDMKKPGYRV